MKKILLTLFVAISAINLQAKVLGSTEYNGKKYYVDVVKTGAKAIIFMRITATSSSIGDLKIAEMNVMQENLGKFINLACRAKESYDDKKAIMGCLSVVGSVFCVAAAVPTVGSAGFACYAAWSYAIPLGGGGVIDCVNGFADKIAEYLGSEKEWAAIGIIANVAEPKYKEAISKAIDLMCKDVKNNLK